jgi:hypothetical protein
MHLSKICLVVFVAVLLLSGFLLSVPGDSMGWYAVMALITIVPIVKGPRKYRMLGVCALVIALALIVTDYQAGKRFRQTHHLSKKIPHHQRRQNLRVNSVSEVVGVVDAVSGQVPVVFPFQQGVPHGGHIRQGNTGAL